MSAELMDIPASFWDAMPEADMHKVIERGYLNAKQCAQLWRLTERNTEPPKRMNVVVYRSDVERLWPDFPK